MPYSRNIILRSGEVITLEEYQTLRKLDSDKVGVHFSLSEPVFSKSFHISELVLILLDAYREKRGRAVYINSLWRSRQKQLDLLAEGYRAAKTSPHEFGMASDIDTTTEYDTRTSVAVMRQVAKDLNIRIRLGYKSYLSDGSTFFHMDVAPEYYCEGMPYHDEPHPIQWENYTHEW